MNYIRIFLLLLTIFLVTSISSTQAQTKRGRKIIVRGGILQKTDSLKLRAEMVLAKMDSMRQQSVDSMIRDSVTTELLDSLEREQFIIDSTLLSRQTEIADSLNVKPDSLKFFKRIFADSASLSKVCWISTVLPGYGQIYNKQYWKLPILYGTLGAGLALFITENKKYKPLKNEYQSIIDASPIRTPELDALQAKMIRSNTRRQIYAGAAIASYIYFIGDAAINYSTNDVSSVKKATTLACIFPGAGQIYNKSYWKVPFVVGGFASMIYVIDWNNRGLKRFNNAYELRVEYDKALAEHNKDPENIPAPKPTGEFGTHYDAELFKNLRDSYRRNRDLAIIATAGIYLIQIIDAHVDAHLKDYDISDDLSMSLQPHVDYTYVPSAGGNRATIGFSLGIKF